MFYNTNANFEIGFGCSSFVEHTRTERMNLKSTFNPSEREEFWILKIEYWLLGLLNIKCRIPNIQ